MKCSVDGHFTQKGIASQTYHDLINGKMAGMNGGFTHEDRLMKRSVKTPAAVVKGFSYLEFWGESE